MTDLFLSYARKDDEPFVRRLYDALTASGLSVWFDREKMPNRGPDFDENIKNAVLNARRLLLIVGTAALSSDYVTKEWLTAYENCIPIIPIMRLSDYGALPELLRHKDAVDFRQDADFEARLSYLLRQVSDAPAPLGHVIGSPRLTHAFVQRQKAWQSLNAALRADDISDKVFSIEDQIAALVGIGGLGKSTLATAFMQQCESRRSFPDGLIWVYLGPDLKNEDVQIRQADIAAVFGDEREKYIDPQAGKVRLSALLKEKDVLIVLDDLWDHRQAEYFFVLGPQSRMLITSRRADIIEKTRAVKDERIIRLDALTEEEALSLISKETGEAVMGSPYEAALRQMIQRLGGHTLAVTLTAAQLKKRGLDYSEKLQERLARGAESETPFKVLAMDERDKNFNVALSMELSYNDLPSDELRQRLRILGIMPANVGFDASIASVLWDNDDEDEVEEDLLALVEAALVECEDEAGRYHLHPIIKSYSAALLRREKEYDAIFLRYVDLIVRTSADTVSQDFEAWETLDIESGHLMYVGDHLVARYASDEALREYALDFAGAMIAYLSLRRELQRPAWLQMGLDIVRQEDDQEAQEVQGYFLEALGLFWSHAGDQRQALDLFEQARGLFQFLQNQEKEADVLNGMGACWQSLGDMQKAREHFERALALHERVGSRDGEASALNSLANLCHEQGDSQQALAYLERALPLVQGADDRPLRATMLTNIGLIWLALGDSQRAFEHVEQALAIQREVGHSGGAADTLQLLANILMAQGENRQAIEYLEQALLTYRATGNRRNEATTLGNLGIAWSNLNEYERALAYHEQSRSIARAIEHASVEAYALNNIATIYQTQGDLRKALECYERALDLHRATGNRGGEATTLGNIGHIYDDLGDLDEAMRQYEQALALARSADKKSTQASTLLGIAGVEEKRGEKQQALGHLEQALALFREIDDKSFQATALGNMSKIWADMGDLDKAMNYAQQALALHQELENRGGEASVLGIMGGIWTFQGEYQRALQFFERSLALSQQIGYLSLEATALNNIGGVLHEFKQHEQALERYQQALQIYRVMGDRQEEARVLNNMASVCSSLGDVQREQALREEALKIAIEGGYRDIEATAFYNASTTYLSLEDHAKALDYAQRAAALFKELHEPMSESSAQTAVAAAYYRLGQLDEAISHMEAGIDVLVQHGLSHNGAGESLEDANVLLAQWRAQRDGQSGAAALPSKEIDMLITNTIAVCTVAAEKQDIWRGELRKAHTHMQKQGAWRQNEVDLMNALLAIVDGKPPQLLEGSPYADIVQRILDGIASPPSNTLSQDMIDTLVSRTVSARVDDLNDAPEWQSTLQAARADWVKRGETWKAEVAFLDALLMILAGEPASLPEDNPYAEAVQRVNEQIAAQAFAPNSLLAGSYVAFQWSDVCLITAFLPGQIEEKCTEMKKLRKQWAEQGARWQHEVALADALLAILDEHRPDLNLQGVRRILQTGRKALQLRQTVPMSADNPYAEGVAQVRQAIQHMKQAADHQARGELTQAVEQYRHAAELRLALGSRRWLVLDRLDALLMNMERYEEALDTKREIITLGQDTTGIYAYWCGVLSLALGQYAQGITYLIQDTSEDAPSQTAAAYWLFIGHTLSHDSASADSSRQKFTALIPTLQPELQTRWQALWALYQGQIDESRALYAAVAEEHQRTGSNIDAPRRYLSVMTKCFPQRREIATIRAEFLVLLDGATSQKGADG